MDDVSLINEIVKRYQENKDSLVSAKDLGIIIPKNQNGKYQTKFLIKVGNLSYPLNFNELGDAPNGVGDMLANEIKNWVKN